MAQVHETTVERRGIARTLKRVKTTFVDGDSPWTPVLVILADYAIWGSIFIVLLALAELAYHFG